MPDDNTLQVRMLGGFSLTYRGKTIDDQSSRSKRLWILLEYLITFRDREISQNDLIDLLWPEGDVSNPANTLKTLLHRARAALAELEFSNGKDLILSRRGAYAWNTRLPLWVDVDAFDQCCRDAAASADEERRLERMMEGVALYQGDFLPKSATEPWAVPINAYHHARYLRLIRDALRLLEARGRYHDVITICQQAVVIDPYEERFHQSLILALAQTGNHQAAVRHYDYVTDLFFNQFGITPSDELQRLYREIVRTEQTLELDLNVIRENLAGSAKDDGAFYCEFAFFKDVYRLYARSCARSGQAIQLALLTLLDPFGQELTQRALNTNMVRLKACIGSCLRRDDVYTRYSASQHLLMLPSANYENGEMVLNRIVRAFKRQYPKAAATIHSRILPLDPDQ